MKVGIDLRHLRLFSEPVEYPVQRHSGRIRCIGGIDPEQMVAVKLDDQRIPRPGEAVGNDECVTGYFFYGQFV